MELVGIESSRVIYLTQVVRPAGQIYLPDAAAKLVQRYSFAKYPSLDELARDSQVFGMGKFRDVQINDLQIYSDGIIVSARADTAILDEFVKDLFVWAGKEFGVVQAVTAKPEKHFESSLVVQSKTDLALSLNPQREVTEILNRVYRGNLTDVGPFQLSGYILDCDPSRVSLRRKPVRFSLERRLGVAFSENVFYSVAPLHTQDHLKVLADLDALSAG
jgi:hypothetical protein